MQVFIYTLLLGFLAGVIYNVIKLLQKLFKNNKNADRKRINHGCKKLDKSLEKIVEPLRLAPSMKNSQPWVLYNKENNIHLYEEKQKKNLSDTNKISMGIALRHFDIACKEFGVDVNY